MKTAKPQKKKKTTVTDEKLEIMAAEIFNFLKTIQANDGILLYRSQSDSASTILNEGEICNLVKEYYANFSLRSHPHVEFAIQYEDEEKVFPNLGEAAEWAAKHSLEKGERVDIEVVIYTNEGVKWYSPDEKDEYEEDQNGFVYDRIRISAEKAAV